MMNAHDRLLCAPEDSRIHGTNMRDYPWRQRNLPKTLRSQEMMMLHEIPVDKDAWLSNQKKMQKTPQQQTCYASDFTYSTKSSDSLSSSLSSMSSVRKSRAHHVSNHTQQGDREKVQQLNPPRPCQGSRSSVTQAPLTQSQEATTTLPLRNDLAKNETFNRQQHHRSRHERRVREMPYIIDEVEHSRELMGYEIGFTPPPSQDIDHRQFRKMSSRSKKESREMTGAGGGSDTLDEMGTSRGGRIGYIDDKASSHVWRPSDDDDGPTIRHPATIPEEEVAYCSRTEKTKSAIAESSDLRRPVKEEPSTICYNCIHNQCFSDKCSGRRFCV